MLTSKNNAPSFDHPLEMLRACHDKILQQCDTLQKLHAHLQRQGSDGQTQQAALSMLRYFDTAGQFHHQDEEENLFPALRAAADLPILDRLLEAHEALWSAWIALRPALVELASGRAATLDDSLVTDFVSRYREHIALENSELLPRAKALLPPSQLAEIGQKMAERRGVKLP